MSIFAKHNNSRSEYLASLSMGDEQPAADRDDTNPYRPRPVNSLADIAD